MMNLTGCRITIEPLESVEIYVNTLIQHDFQVMVQKHNRHSSMSVYLAVLTIPDTILLCHGRYLKISDCATTIEARGQNLRMVSVYIHRQF